MFVLSYGQLLMVPYGIIRYRTVQIMDVPQPEGDLVVTVVPGPYNMSVHEYDMRIDTGGIT